MSNNDSSQQQQQVQQIEAFTGFIPYVDTSNKRIIGRLLFMQVMLNNKGMRMYFCDIHDNIIRATAWQKVVDQLSLATLLREGNCYAIRGMTMAEESDEFVNYGLKLCMQFKESTRIEAVENVTAICNDRLVEVPVYKKTGKKRSYAQMAAEDGSKDNGATRNVKAKVEGSQHAFEFKWTQ